MTKRYILAIDQSTQGTKAVLFGAAGELVARADRPHRQLVDDLGWVEHDPAEIMAALYGVVADVIAAAGIDPAMIAAVGISNQRETVVAWDRVTGKPIYNAIVWQCARAEKICERIKDAGHAVKIRKATGLPLSPYFSAGKLAWIMENVADAEGLAAAGRLACGTMDSYVVWELTGGKEFRTDVSNASRTQLFNITDLAWDEEIAHIFGVPMAALPEVSDSNACYGYTDFAGLLPAPIPIHAVLGDSHAALYGQGCIAPGGAKATYGTGSSVMFNTGERQVRSRSGLVTSLAWRMNGLAHYVLEGNINYTGATISWLKDELGLINSPAETEELARSANPSDRTYLVPAFTGLGAPYWDTDVRGILTGMSRVTGRAEIVRAAVDSIAYQIADIIRIMQEEAGQPLTALRVDGGPTRNSYLMQLQADILRLPVEPARIEELSAAGAAFAAGRAVGLYDDTVFSAIEHRGFSPLMERAESEARYAGWRGAVRQAVHYHDQSA